jgi:hypothetical protein
LLRPNKYGDIPAQGKINSDRVILSLAGIVVLEFLSQRVCLTPDYRILSGGIVCATSEYLVGNQVFIQLGSVAVQKRFANESEELRMALRSAECTARQNDFEFGSDFIRERGHRASRFGTDMSHQR